MSKNEFYNKYRAIAIAQHFKSGVPASITLAQAALESGYGKSQLATKGNNFFGIKAYSNPDNLPVLYFDDDKKGEPFRKYDNVKDSFKDHSKFLMVNPRYNSLFNSHDYKSWAYGLEKASYSTTAGYGDVLIDLIENNGLAKYDIVGKNKNLILILIFLIVLLAVFLLNRKYKFI